MLFNFKAGALCLSLCGAATVATADIINVPADYPTIQQGIDAAVDGDQVWVADGTYTGEGNRDIDFHGKAIIVRSQSGDPNLCIIDCEGDANDPHRAFVFQSGEGNDSRLEGFTITSGWAQEYGGAVYILNGGPTIRDCVFSPADGGTNHVGYLGSGGAVSSIDSSALFIDCVFDNNGAIDYGRGGAMFIQGGATQLINCTFSGNVADRGGGVYIVEAAVTLSNCAFIGNEVEEYDGVYGGGIYCVDGNLNLLNCSFESNSLESLYVSSGAGAYIVDSVAEWVNCSFTDNVANGCYDIFGGAVYDDGGDAIFINCDFFHNVVWAAEYDLGGGGLYHTDGDLVLINCSFVENSVLGGDYPRGGGVYHSGGSALLVNCLLAGNELTSLGGEGGGMYGGASTVLNCTIVENIAACGGGGAHCAIVTNSIVSGNISNGGELLGDPDDTTVSYSDVRGGWPGEGNIEAYPKFVDPDNGDYRLAPGSPCIDAGDNDAVPKDITTDLDGNPRFVDDPKAKDTGDGDRPIVDIGAYEFQVVSPSPWDLNGDGVVDGADLIVLLGAWGPCDDCNDCLPDFDGDCTVGTADLLILLGNWG